MIRTAIFSICLLFLLPVVSQAQFTSPVPLSGHAWSSNIGWLSFSGPGYGVQIETNGNLSGYAWSSNIGWVNFQLGSGCPSGSCRARLNTTTNELTGWARACAVTSNGDCTGALDSNSGGWDGWISLNCNNTGACATNGYKVTAAPSNFSNYAWGGDVVGWLKFDNVTFTPPCSSASATCTTDLSGINVSNQWCAISTVPCSSGYQCNVSNPNSCMIIPPTATLTVAPRVILSGGTTNLSWTSTNAGSCTVSQTNPAGDASRSWNALSGSNVVSDPISNTTIFRITCTDSTGLPATTVEVASTSIDVVPQLIEI